MHRTLTACAAITAIAVLARAMPTPAPEPAPMAGDCPNLFVVEPLVMFDSSGFGLGGPIHRRMTAYNNGLVSVSRAIGTGDESNGSASFDWLPPTEVFQLARDLYDVGAWSICDEVVPIPDTPLTTVTVLRGATNAPSHTYSYFYPGSQEAQAAAGILQAFMGEHFPGF